MAATKPIYSRLAMSCRLHPDAILDDVRRAALSEVEKFSTPPTVEQIEEWLAELSVVVARRDGDALTERLRVEAYASRLRAYPADVVREALLSARWRFFPTWAEVAEVCDALSAYRRGTAALLRAMSEADRVAPHPETPRLDWKTARRIMAEYGLDGA